MTREEVLAVTGLTTAQKARVEAFYKSYDNFKWAESKDDFAKCRTKKEVLDVISNLQKAYDKRKELEAKARAKKQEKQIKKEKLMMLVEQAEQYGFSIDDIIGMVTDTYKKIHNDKILAEIEELNKKLI